MAESGAERDAAAAQLGREIDRLRLSLAARRYDAHAAAVLSGTARSWLSSTSGSLRLRARRTVLRTLRRWADRVAPPGTARRVTLRTAVLRVRPEGSPVSGARSSTMPPPRRITPTRSVRSDPRTYGVRPLVSAIVAVGPGELAATLVTLQAQTYDRLEVVVASDDPLELPEVTVVVASGQAEDRINAAAAAATGEFLVVLHAGDRLDPSCVSELVAAVQLGADAAYGDEDRLGPGGERVARHDKPATLGRETLLSYDVIGAPLLTRATLFAELGGLAGAAAPVAAHDFALRLAERTPEIVHVAEVLLSRPIDLDPDPSDATAATIPVVAAAVERLGATATVTCGEVLPSVRVVLDAPTPAPSVAIVIPTRDRLDLLGACIESVQRRTTYSNYSIVICDNDSKEADTLAWLEDTEHTVVRCPGPFNYSSIVNRGVASTAADFVVTLNNDTTIATPDWLDHLVGLCSLPGVGSVGVKLVFPDGRLQHEGVGIMPLPVHLSRDTNCSTPDRWLSSMRNAAAVTGACQIVRSEAWRAIDGLDEDQPVGYNDVDFGLRLVAAGWRVAYTPEVVVGHKESATRGNLHPIEDVHRLIARWDLLGDFKDPSVPPSMRFVTSSVELSDTSGPAVVPALRGPLLPSVRDGEPVDVNQLQTEHAELVELCASAPSPPKTATLARWLGREARAILDDGPPTDVFGSVAPPGTRRRHALRAVATRAVAARRGRDKESEALRRYRLFEVRARPSALALEARVAALGSLQLRPLVSVVVDGGVDGGGVDVTATLGSLRAQCYDRIEPVLSVSASMGGHPDVVVIAHEGATEDRINAAVKASAGEFVLVLRAGDLPAPHCVHDLVAAIQDGADAAYGDEDRHDEHGARVAWHLKPATLGLETLLSYDAVGAPLLLRRSMFADLGGLDAASAPAAAHDFALRLAERTPRIVHVAEVLVSRAAASEPDLADSTAATVPIVTAALERRGAVGTVRPGELLPSVRFVVAPPPPTPSVAIVIPTRDRLDLLRACVESVERRSTYRSYSIVICDNDSVEPATLEWLAATTHDVVRCPGSFNYPRIVNRGVAHTSADFVVTLNNDTTIATPDWLERLVGLCSLPDVASVGVKLAYPDGRLQHEGVGIIPLPVHLSRDATYRPADRWLDSTRDASAVTGACQIVRTDAWRALGGLDEVLAVAFNDVDFAMRLAAAGWRVAYTPEVILGHHESASRGSLHPLSDETLLIERWDLLGGYVDPSMPPAMRLVAGEVDFVVPGAHPPAG